jgi:hypothetical protein
MTTSDMNPDDIELEADYEISYHTGSYRNLHGYTLVDLHNAHLLPGELEIKRTGAPE